MSSNTQESEVVLDPECEAHGHPDAGDGVCSCGMVVYSGTRADA
jgi:hypothetical protein